MSLALASSHRFRSYRKVELSPKAGDDEHQTGPVVVNSSISGQLRPVSGQVTPLPAGLDANASWWVNVPAGTDLKVNDIFVVLERLDGSPGADVGSQYVVVWVVPGTARPSGSGFWDTEVFLDRSRADHGLP